MAYQAQSGEQRCATAKELQNTCTTEHSIMEIDLTRDEEVCSLCCKPLEVDSVKYILRCFCDFTRVCCHRCMEASKAKFSCPSHPTATNAMKTRVVYSSVCSICLDDDCLTKTRVVMRCGHLFCSKDAWTWAKMNLYHGRSVKCPLCKVKQGSSYRTLGAQWIRYNPMKRSPMKIITTKCRVEKTSRKSTSTGRKAVSRGALVKLAFDTLRDVWISVQSHWKTFSEVLESTLMTPREHTALCHFKAILPIEHPERFLQSIYMGNDHTGRLLEAWQTVRLAGGPIVQKEQSERLHILLQRLKRIQRLFEHSKDEHTMPKGGLESILSQLHHFRAE